MSIDFIVLNDHKIIKWKKELEKYLYLVIKNKNIDVAKISVVPINTDMLDTVLKSLTKSFKEWNFMEKSEPNY